VESGHFIQDFLSDPATKRSENRWFEMRFFRCQVSKKQKSIETILRTRKF
jgi:hypothetical protein